MARRRIYNLNCKNPLCGKEYKGQLDQMYCSKECKNDVGNAKKREENKAINKINKILLKNHRVLMDNYDYTNPTKKTSLAFLKLKGLKINYFTNFEQSEKDSSLIYWIYDYGMSEKMNEIIIYKK